jgi:hypothetical protein
LACLRSLAVVMVSGCLSPSFAELGSEACSDDRDNDGDGLVDCEDPDCAPTGLCEHLAGACTDGRDNDGDGLGDCTDPDCWDLEPCLTRLAVCSSLDGSGCSHGLACHARLQDGLTECRVPGAIAEFDTCRATSGELPAAPRDVCMPGTGCQSHAPASLGLCSRHCMRDEDCLYGGQCLGSREALPGLCTVPCAPPRPGAPPEPSDCPEDFACLAGQALGISRAAGGYRYRCVEERTFLRAGFIDDDETVCADPEDDVLLAAEAVCEPGRLCWGARVDELRCRVVCPLSGPELGCRPDEHCVDVAHAGGTPVGVSGQAWGVCVPDEAP